LSTFTALWALSPTTKTSRPPKIINPFIVFRLPSLRGVVHRFELGQPFVEAAPGSNIGVQDDRSDDHGALVITRPRA
ncbi:MAG: hypothetical protein ACLP3C_01085, partial [Mycobacterium sp.]|uniref:hypothetical protein n=1 Tax=Mycobacterium sp. TaxID=1785 RepID=UPI003F965237